MVHQPARIKIIVAAGVPAADAIKAALPMQINEFAAKHKLARTAVSMCIHGKQRHGRVRAALAQELGVEREWLDQLLDASPGKAPGAEVGAQKVA